MFASIPAHSLYFTFKWYIQTQFKAVFALLSKGLLAAPLNIPQPVMLEEGFFPTTDRLCE